MEKNRPHRQNRGFDNLKEGTVNGWRAGGEGGYRIVEKMGEDVCPHFLQPLHENIDRRSCNDGSRELIPLFYNPHRKCRPSRSVVSRTLEYLVSAPS